MVVVVAAGVATGSNPKSALDSRSQQSDYIQGSDGGKGAAIERSLNTVELHLHNSHLYNS